MANKLRGSEPLVVGGMGGSGTRIVTEILKHIGFFMGSDLNRSNDHMQLARSFPIFRSVMLDEENERLRIKYGITKKHNDSEIKQVIFAELLEFEKMMSYDYQQEDYIGWGWKIPGNFLILDYISKYFGSLKYIHVIRHGIDMAFSGNINQLRDWGKYYDIIHNGELTPKLNFEYWIKSNKHACKLGSELLGDKFFLLNFDNLCINPEVEIQRLMSFLKIQEYDETILKNMVTLPKSIGRYKQHDIKNFHESDIDIVKSYGFEV